MTHVNPATLNQNELIVATAAMRNFADGLTYMGTPIGKYVTDEECKQAAVAVLAALAGLKAGTTI
jgi:hypothetical protein